MTVIHKSGYWCEASSKALGLEEEQPCDLWSGRQLPTRVCVSECVYVHFLCAGVTDTEIGTVSPRTGIAGYREPLDVDLRTEPGSTESTLNP